MKPILQRSRLSTFFGLRNSLSERSITSCYYGAFAFSWSRRTQFSFVSSSCFRGVILTRTGRKPEAGTYTLAGWKDSTYNRKSQILLWVLRSLPDFLTYYKVYFCLQQKMNFTLIMGCWWNCWRFKRNQMYSPLWHYFLNKLNEFLISSCLIEWSTEFT